MLKKLQDLQRASGQNMGPGAGGSCTDAGSRLAGGYGIPSAEAELAENNSTQRSLWLLLLMLLLPSIRLLAQQPSKTLKVPDGTPVRLSLMDSLNSATNHVDDPIHLEVTEDVKAGDLIAIPKGSTAAGHVVEVEPKRRLGRAGKLNFSVDFVKAPDGSNVRLRATSTRHGQDKTGTVIVGTVLLSPLFLIMRGKDVNIPKGTAFNAYIDGEREIAAVDPPRTSSPSQPVAQQRSSEQVCAVTLKSTPEGADVTVDDRFVGSTPSTLQLGPGDHKISIAKSGHKPWQRTVTLSPGGNITLDATLEKNQ